MVQALLNRILQDGPQPQSCKTAAIPEPQSEVAADMEDLGSQACPCIPSPLLWHTSDSTSCSGPSDQAPHAMAHVLGAMQAGADLAEVAEPALAPTQPQRRLELEWLRLVPLEAAREYLMSIRGELLAPHHICLYIFLHLGLSGLNTIFACTQVLQLGSQGISHKPKTPTVHQACCFCPGRDTISRSRSRLI